jgi:hypothetical protein
LIGFSTLKSTILSYAVITMLMVTACWSADPTPEAVIIDERVDINEVNVTCHEDEYARVKHDPDPTHGLTWECVVADEVHDQWFDGGWNAAIECMYKGGTVKTWGCEY